MRTLHGPGAAAGRAALGGLAAGLMVGLAACGNTVAGAGTAGPGGPLTPAASASPGATAVNPGGVMIPAPAANHAALCRAIPGLRRMTLMLSSHPPGVPVREVLPGGFTVRDAATVRRFAALLCALPAVPPGRMMCSNMLGGSYRLFFFAPGRNFPVVAIETSGCRVVTGLGPARSWPASVSLGQALGQHFGIHFPLGPKR
jgi:hypothetical protein